MKTILLRLTGLGFDKTSTNRYEHYTKNIDITVINQNQFNVNFTCDSTLLEEQHQTFDETDMWQLISDLQKDN